MNREAYSLYLDRYYNFSSSHFIVHDNFREPLHGHNYSVSLTMKSKKLNQNQIVVDISIINEIMNKINTPLDGYLLIGRENPNCEFKEEFNNFNILYVFILIQL